MEQNFCAPGARNEYGSCFTYELLQKIAKDLNNYFKENGIDAVISNSEINSSFPNLQRSVHSAYKKLIPNGCKGDHCYLLTDVYKDKNLSAFNDVFKPFVDNTWYNNPNSWLSTPHIADSISQLMNVHDDFKWYGASPQDIFHPGVCSAYGDICNINVGKLLKNGKTRMGIVFNLDDHTQSGSHWVGLYSDFNKGGVYYFDSTGRFPQEDTIRLMRKIFNQGNKLLLNGEHKIDDSHCINCKCECLEKDTFRIPDKYANYFVPGSVIEINNNKFLIGDRHENKITLLSNQGGGKKNNIHNNNHKYTSDFNQMGGFIGKKMNILLKSFKCFFNKKDHQRKNTECGVYSIDFITNMVNGGSFYDVANKIVRDEEMWTNRYLKYFTPSNWDKHKEIMEAVNETKRVMKANGELSTKL